MHSVPPVGHGRVGDEAEAADQHHDQEPDEDVQAEIVFFAFFAL